MTADRTMTLERRIDAPLEVVFAAWTDPQAIPQWWGPEGFTCKTKSMENGVWIFDMIGPDGTVFPNRHRIIDLVPLSRIRYLLDDGVDRDGPPHGDVTVTFTDLGGATRVTMEMVMGSAEDYQNARSFGAIRLGYQTLAKLATFVGAD